MFERYTDDARRTLFFARREAAQLGSASIGPEHLLLGIASERNAFTAGILARVGLLPEEVRARNDGARGQHPPIDRSAHIPFTMDAKRVLEYAAEESSSLNQTLIGPEHLLLGLLRHEHGLAWDILEGKGLTLAGARDDLVSHFSSTSLSRGPDTSSQIAAVQSVVTQILHAIDMRRWSMLPPLFTAYVITDYTTLFGGDVQQKQRDDLISGWRQSLSPLDATQHLLGPIDVHLIGYARADADCHVRVYHVWQKATGGNEWMVAGHDLFELEMNNGAWQVSDLTLHLLYQTGNRNILEQAGRASRG